jgi:AmmeMemoRadiSam system protein A
VDVWNNAYASAFADPRFPALTAAEWNGTGIEISVLSEPEHVDVRSEAELLEMLRPGIDGLILQAGARRSTFLPAVWEQLPGPRDFVRHLKLKAGWPADFWPPDMQVWLYTTESFG